MLNPVEMGDGPDRIIPTERLTTWEQDGATKIRKTSEYPGNIEPRSLIDVIDQTCQESDFRTAYKIKIDGKWVNTSYSDYHKKIRCVARAFVKLGLEPLKSVAIIGFNSPEWFQSDLGAIYAGGIAVGLYPTNSLEMNKFILGDCRANILVAEDDMTTQQVWEIRNELPHLKKIVQYSGNPPDLPDVISWQQLIDIGNEDQDDEPLKERHRNMAINQCCTLVYTSGTTGNPKGVMLSHDNIYWTFINCLEYVNGKKGCEVMISYLPLSHIAANINDIWAMFGNQSTIVFADKMALKGTLLKTMQEARPTIFFGVPRVWEKIQEGMMNKARDAKGLKKAISTACKKAGLQHHLDGKDGPMYTIGKKAMYKKVREALGLDRCHGFYSGAAPLSPETIKYFLSLDIIVHELYGMSEVSGPFSAHTGPFRMGSVGPALPSCKVLLYNKDQAGNGEVCMWGRNVMMGYLNREDKTKEEVDSDGYLHSGDLGSLDSEGHIYITGRIKELLITAGGENIAPTPIEEEIKKELPCLSNAVLIGDKKKFLTVFLTFRVVMDKDDSPTNNLTPQAIDWVRSVGSNAKTVSDILKGPDGKVMKAIQDGIDRANKQAVSRAAIVQKWTVLPKDISLPGGELGSTLKLKRFYFNKKYAKAINLFYI